MSPASTIHDALACRETASSARSAAGSKLAASQQHQKWTRTGRAYPWGMCAPIPAVDHSQDRPVLTCRAGTIMSCILLPRFMGHGRVSPLAILLPANRGTRLHLPVSAKARAPGLFIHAPLRGSRPFAAQSVSGQRPVNIAVPEIHHAYRLSSADLVGIDPNEIGLTHAQKFFAPGAKTND